MNKTIRSDFSGHTLFVREIEVSEMPALADGCIHYSRFYEVRNFDEKGAIFMYLAKGYKGAPKQIVAWYPKGGFWHGFGTTFKSAIEGAQRDGWLSA